MDTSPKRLLTLAFAIVPFVIAGCEGGGGETGDGMDTTAASDTSMSPSGAIAMVSLQPTGAADSVRGQITFAEVQDGVRISGQVQNLAPGMHGFHVHQNGDCSNQGKAAGGHFAPNGNPHGAPTDPDSAHHTGDLGNIQADQSGMAQVDTTVQFLELSGRNSIIGRGMIVHQGRDDLTSQPSGAAGSRVACGTIQMQGAMGGNATEDTIETMQGTGTGEDGTAEGGGEY